MILIKKVEEYIEDCDNITDLAKILDLDLKTLLFFAYRNEGLYTHYKIKKKDGKFRDIHAPNEALKTICKKLNYYLSNVYDDYVPKSAHGFVRGRGILSNARGHIKTEYVLNLDLENFFGTINSGRILGLFRRHPFRFGNKLSSVLTGIVTHNNSLPQGAPTSPVLANMVCLKLDKELIRLAIKYGWRYSRYADDITFSSDELSEELAVVRGDRIFVGKRIENIIKKNGFSINEKKTRLAVPNESKWVTGIKVNEKLNLSRKYIRRVRSMLNAWEVYKEDLAEKKFNRDYNSGKSKSFRQVLRGRIDHIGNVRGKNDLLYKKLYNRLCDLENRFDKRLPETKKDEYLNKVLVIKSSLGYGSGFFISKNIIITCAHVVGTDRNVEFTTKRYRMPVEFRGASVLTINSAKDYAILYVISDNSDLVFKCNPRKTMQNFSQEEEYISIGYGGFRKQSNLWDDPAAVDQKIVQKDITGNSLRVDRPMWSGMSGGPVVSKLTSCVDGYIIEGAETLAGSLDIKSFVFYPIANIPSEYFEETTKKHEDPIPF